MKPPSPEAIQQALSEVHRQIDHARVNVSHADTKAALLAAGAIPITALFVTSPLLNGHFGFSVAMSWIGIGFMLLAITSLGAVVWPRLAGTSGIRNGANRSAQQIVARTLETSSSPARQLEAAAAELSFLSTLALSKFRKIQAAILCFAVAAVFMLVAAVA
ncbi:hypothetical protein SAMN05216298_5073 [Glycomyces sambucus]|uniref:Pycsar effector protein domain-containing protein n=1 Tax=Glycomyces sambucus TaxID=380244 RepID=A0A1G9MNR0_9ACTN|nr:Pycsar system effector family protein [Glycomyces sambucus]SDL75547.1 hypothetical protein SAMN05216298_5073 [Glycomyces sambucus]